MPAITK